MLFSGVRVSGSAPETSLAAICDMTVVAADAKTQGRAVECDDRTDAVLSQWVRRAFTERDAPADPGQ